MLGAQQPVDMFSSQEFNPLQQMGLQTGQQLGAHRRQSSDILRLVNAHSGHGVNILTYETDQRALRERLTKMETDYHGLMQRLSQIEQEILYSINPTLPNSDLLMNYPITGINYPVNPLNLG